MFMMPLVHIQIIIQCYPGPLSSDCDQTESDCVFLLQPDHSFSVKTLSLLHLAEINNIPASSLAHRLSQTDRHDMENRGSKQWWSSTVIIRAGLSQSRDGWSRLTKQMFSSGGLCRSLSRISFDKRRIRWRNASHPCNSLLRLSLTSLAIKAIFIEGRGQTLMLSRDCSTPVEVINIKANMAV